MRSRRGRGMSLIEMMFVLAILGILMAIGTGAYRRMQVNNLFTADVQKLGGELRLLGGAARAFGLRLLNTGNPPQAIAPRNNEALAAPVQGGARGFVWRTYERSGSNTQPRKRAEGRIGERQSVTAQWSNAYNGVPDVGQGVWLEMIPTAGSPVMRVIFEPDGTPLDAGSIVLRNNTTTYTINITRMGAIEGPR